MNEQLTRRSTNAPFVFSLFSVITIWRLISLRLTDGQPLTPANQASLLKLAFNVSLNPKYHLLVKEGINSLIEKLI